MIYQIMFNISWVVLVVTSLFIGVGIYLLFTYYSTWENPEPPVFFFLLFWSFPQGDGGLAPAARLLKAQAGDGAPVGISSLGNTAIPLSFLSCALYHLVSLSPGLSSGHPPHSL